MNCGDAVLSRPSVGSWITYGLGTENQNLPSFIAMCPGGYPVKAAENWQAGFLPGVFQGTLNQEHQQKRHNDAQLEARIQSFHPADRCSRSRHTRYPGLN
jgi:hypothetical protein